MSFQNVSTFVLVVILVVSLSSTEATFDWLAKLLGISSGHRGAGGHRWGPGSNRQRPFGTINGGGYVGGSGGSVPGGSEYLGGGWSGAGNVGYANPYSNSVGFLESLATGREVQVIPFSEGGNTAGQSHHIHRHGHSRKF